MSVTHQLPTPGSLVRDIDARFEMGQISQVDHDRWIATLNKAISRHNDPTLRGYVSLVVNRELRSTLNLTQLSA